MRWTRIGVARSRRLRRARGGVSPSPPPWKIRPLLMNRVANAESRVRIEPCSSPARSGNCTAKISLRPIPRREDADNPAESRSREAAANLADARRCRRRMRAICGRLEQSGGYGCGSAPMPASWLPAGEVHTPFLREACGGWSAWSQPALSTHARPSPTRVARMRARRVYGNVFCRQPFLPVQQAGIATDAVRCR